MVMLEGESASSLSAAYNGVFDKVARMVDQRLIELSGPPTLLRKWLGTIVLVGLGCVVQALRYDDVRKRVLEVSSLTRQLSANCVWTWGTTLSVLLLTRLCAILDQFDCNRIRCRWRWVPF